MSKETKAIAEIINDALKMSGQSIRKVAESAGVSYSHLSKIIRQEVPISKPEYLEKIAAPLQLPYCKLFIAAGYFDNFSIKDTSSFYSISFDCPVIIDLKPYLNSYLAFRGIKFMRLWPDAKNEEEARKQWWLLFDAFQDYRPKCELLISLFNSNNSYFEIIDEALYVFDLIPAKFILENQLPLFNKFIQCVFTALTDVLINHLDEDEDYDAIWLIYEKHLEGVKQLLSPSYTKEEKKPNQGTSEDWNVPQRPGFKLFLEPDGNAYGRIDFNIPINKIHNIYKLVSKIQKSIEEFYDSETD